MAVTVLIMVVELVVGKVVAVTTLTVVITQNRVMP
ncbi:Uncharacterised protein [Klebsiella oxytoca]|nr:hypothetical protein SMKC004_18450 [Serratia marcescens]SAQ17741.1 Uncharacterised protein [Klebsiella oxytoca]